MKMQILKKKTEKEFNIKRIISNNETVKLPIEKKLELIETYIQQLRKLAEVTDEINSYTFQALKTSHFEPLLTKIKERLYGEKG